MSGWDVAIAPMPVLASSSNPVSAGRRSVTLPAPLCSRQACMGVPAASMLPLPTRADSRPLMPMSLTSPAPVSTAISPHMSCTTILPAPVRAVSAPVSPCALIDPVPTSTRNRVPAGTTNSYLIETFFRGIPSRTSPMRTVLPFSSIGGFDESLRAASRASQSSVRRPLLMRILPTMRTCAALPERMLIEPAPFVTSRATGSLTLRIRPNEPVATVPLRPMSPARATTASVTATTTRTKARMTLTQPSVMATSPVARRRPRIPANVASRSAIGARTAAERPSAILRGSTRLDWAITSVMTLSCWRDITWSVAPNR